MTYFVYKDPCIMTLFRPSVDLTLLSVRMYSQACHETKGIEKKCSFLRQVDS